MPMKVIVPKRCKECGYPLTQKSPLPDICFTCFLLKPEYQTWTKNVYPELWQKWQKRLEEETQEESRRLKLSEEEKKKLWEEWARKVRKK